MENEFTIGQIFSKSFQVFNKNFFFMLIISVLVSIPGAIIYAAPESSLSMSVAFLASSIMTFLAQAIVIYGVFQHLTGRSMVFSQSLAVALRRFFPVLGVSIVVAILSSLGLLLFVIPGIIVQMMFWVAVPVIVVERNGIGGALQRSMKLTEGYRWRIFFLTVLLGLLTGALTGLEQMIMVGVFAGGPGQDPVLGFLVGLPLSVFLSGMAAALTSVMVTVGYYTLRHEVEGVAPEDLAAVFE